MQIDKLIFLLFLLLFSRIGLAADPIRVEVDNIKFGERAEARLEIDSNNSKRGTLTLFKQDGTVSRVVPIFEPELKELKTFANQTGGRYVLSAQALATFENEFYLNLGEPGIDGTYTLSALGMTLHHQVIENGHVRRETTSHDFLNDKAPRFAEPILESPPLEFSVALKSTSPYKETARILNWDGHFLQVIPEVNLIRWMAGLDKELLIVSVDPSMCQMSGHDKGLHRLKELARHREEFDGKDWLADFPLDPATLIDNEEEREELETIRRLFGPQSQQYQDAMNEKAETKEARRIIDGIRTHSVETLKPVKVRFFSKNPKEPKAWLPGILRYTKSKERTPLLGLLTGGESVEDCRRLYEEARRFRSN